MRLLLHVCLMGRVGGGSRGRDTARLDALLHDVIHSVPACGNPRIQRLPEYHDCSYARCSTSCNSRPERGPGLLGVTTWSRRGSLCMARQDAGGKLAFAQQLSGRTHIETWAGGCKSLNLRISQEQEIKGRFAVSAFPPRTPIVTPVLPGPGSDIRMKMGWKVTSKTEKSGVWFFQSAGSLYGRWVLRLLAGTADWVREGSYHTAWSVPWDSSCTCSCAHGRGPAVGISGERCWPLLASVWTATAPLMTPWCAEAEVPTAANLNLYRRRDSCVRWLCDDGPLFAWSEKSKHIVSVSFGMEGQVLSGR